MLSSDAEFFTNVTTADFNIVTIFNIPTEICYEKLYNFVEITNFGKA